ncbi:MAG: hypothetical protein ACPGVU_06470 [Limisphaerales bacterium]
MQGDFLICNAIGFLGTKQYQVHRDGGFEPTFTTGKRSEAKTTTSTTKLGEVWGTSNGQDLKVTKTMSDGTKIEEESKGLLLSGDKNFRPTDAIVPRTAPSTSPTGTTPSSATSNTTSATQP